MNKFHLSTRFNARAEYFIPLAAWHRCLPAATSPPIGVDRPPSIEFLLLSYHQVPLISVFYSLV